LAELIERIGREGFHTEFYGKKNLLGNGDVPELEGDGNILLRW
jgi:hypothetical protein